MRQPNSLLKAATLMSSVLLLSAFVCYRAGAFNTFMETSPPPADSGLSPVPEEPPSSATEEKGTIMSSSKSIILSGSKVTPSLGGYKYVVVPTSPNEPDAQPAALVEQPPSKATERARTIMPGPKSFEPLIVLPPPNKPNAIPPPSPEP